MARAWAWSIGVGAAAVAAVLALILVDVTTGGLAVNRQDVLPGIARMICVAAFTAFAGRALLAQPAVGARFSRLPRPARWACGALLVAVAAPLAMGLTVALLFFVGGLLTAQILDGFARRNARPPAWAAKRPVAFPALLALGSAAGAVVHSIAAYLLYASDAPRLASAAVDGASRLLLAAALVGATLALAAAFGRGRERAPRRALHALILLYPAGWYGGFVVASVHDGRTGLEFPLLALGLLTIQVALLLRRVRGRVVDDYALVPRHAQWDLVLALLFTLLLRTVDNLHGGALEAGDVIAMKAPAWTGLLVGLTVIPAARWVRGRRAARASV